MKTIDVSPKYVRVEKCQLNSANCTHSESYILDGTNLVSLVYMSANNMLLMFCHKNSLKTYIVAVY